MVFTRRDLNVLNLVYNGAIRPKYDSKYNTMYIY